MTKSKEIDKKLFRKLLYETLTDYVKYTGGLPGRGDIVLSNFIIYLNNVVNNWKNNDKD